MLAAPTLATAQNSPPTATAPAAATTAPASYQQAQQALAEQDWAKARQLLLQTIDQSPEWAAAWLDLAWLTWRQGDRVAAQEILWSVREQFAPLPAPVQAAVNALEQQLQPSASAQAPTAAMLQAATTPAGYLLLAAGLDNNVNAGPNIEALTLTHPAGLLVLPLDPASRARSDSFVRGSGLLQGSLSEAHGLGWQVQGNMRNHLHESAFDTADLQGQLVWRGGRPLPGAEAERPWRAALTTQHARMGGQALYQANGLQLQRQAMAWGGCRLSASAQHEARQYLSAPVLNGRWLSLGGSWGCGGGWQGLLRVGLDLPETAERPGGLTRQTTAGLGYQWQLPAGQRLQLWGQRQQALDSEGYNPLLDRGSARRVQRTELSLVWQQPLAGKPGWQTLWGLQVHEQTSNIALFRQNGLNVQFMLYRGWP